MRTFLLSLACVFFAFLSACTHQPTREPAQEPAMHYAPERVRILRAAAEHGVLFHIPDNVVRDVPSRAIGDRCRASQDAPWIDRVLETLHILERQTKALGKIHILELRRADRPGVEIVRDLDGGVTLQLQYAKVESRETIQTLADIPCAQGDMELVGKDMTIVHFEWPDPLQIQAATASLPERPEVERFKFDTRFLTWLSDRVTIFRLTPEVAFEKTPTGQPLLPVLMAALSQEVSSVPRRAALDFWLKEVSTRSRSGAGLKFFGVFKDMTLAHGLQVESVGQFTRKMNGYADPTFPYVTYKIENSAYQFSSVTQLDSCLSSLMSTYRSPVAAMSSYDMDPDSFMFPGHHCQASTGD